MATAGSWLQNMHLSSQFVPGTLGLAVDQGIGKPASKLRPVKSMTYDKCFANQQPIINTFCRMGRESVRKEMTTQTSLGQRAVQTLSTAVQP